MRHFLTLQRSLRFRSFLVGDVQEHPAELISRPLSVDMRTGSNPDPTRLAIWVNNTNVRCGGPFALRFPKCVSGKAAIVGMDCRQEPLQRDGSILLKTKYRPARFGSPQTFGCPIELPQSNTGGNSGKGHAILTIPERGLGLATTATLK